VPKEQAVNKIGHALHELDPVFKDATFAWSIKEIAHKLHFQDPRVLQSMLIFKQPKIGGPVPPHQDTTFLYTEPHSAVGYWLALEDCTRENGCLAFIPGSHKTTPVTRRFVRRKDGQGTEFTGYDNLVDCKEEDFVWETCPAGSLVLIHGAVVHRSLANTSPHSRWAYAFHVIEGNAEYSADNWHVTFITH
jgi:ectoine hydroxylase-related dioxygenase (phytanoyl-CoA dioxygenase family)